MAEEYQWDYHPKLSNQVTRAGLMWQRGPLVSIFVPVIEVAITNPVEGAVFTAPVTIQVDAVTVTSQGSTVTQAQFYANSIMLGTDSVPPYSYNWLNVTSGFYVLTARVWNDQGAMATSMPIQVQVIPGTAITDQDGDGLPDDLEEEYFGGPTNANPNALCTNGADSVRQAYIAGINTTNPAARFALHLAKPLTWNSASGRQYTVYRTTNLLEDFQPLQTGLVGGSFTDTVHGAERKNYYKIGVELAP